MLLSTHIRPSKFLIIMIAAYALLSGYGCFDLLAPSADRGGNWMPLAVGDTWTYQWRDNIGTAYEQPKYVTERIDSALGINDEDWYGGNSDYYLKRRDGYYHANLSIDGWRSPIRVVPHSGSVGDTISVNVSNVDSMHSTQYVRILEATDTTITVPAGTYHCICTATYETTYNRNWPDRQFFYLTYSYYARDVGQVKSESWTWNDQTTPKRDFIKELVSYELP
jgi:hypothetical protein